MKIICTDNFGRETVNDRLVCENVNEFYGSKIVEFLNERYSGDYSSDFYRLVNDDYRLYVWEP